MNSWAKANEQYQYNMMAMSPTNPSMMPNQMYSPPLPLNDGMMPQTGVPEWKQNQESNTGPGNNFIGPIPPECQDTTTDLTQDEESNELSNQGLNKTYNSRGSRSKQSSKDRWNKNRDTKDSGRQDRSDRNRRPRSQDRNRERGDRSRSDRDRGRDNRVSRFSARDDPPIPSMAGSGGPGLNMMMPGMMSYGNTMVPGQQSTLDMSNMAQMPSVPPTPNMSLMPQMPNMPHMLNMSQMPNMIPGMNMHPNMMGNMIPGMMDQNSMMIAQQQMQLASSQPIYMQGGVLLAPIPGVSMPPTRDRPAGCRTIFVGGLPAGIGLDTITDIFQRFGIINDIKLHKQGVCHVRFLKQESVEQSFFLSGFRFRTHDQNDNEATSIFIDYALNRDDQTETEKQKREPTPPTIEQFTPTALSALGDKIKSDTDFAESAPTLAAWLERGECNKKNANAFYSVIQACNNQVRRLYNEKMVVDEEFLNMKTTMKEKFVHIICQFEQVAKILSAAKHKRASDHFSKQQRRNIEMWLKMTEDLENIKDEFNVLFDEEETEKTGQKMVTAEKYEQLKVENDTLICELEGYRNEAHLARHEADRKFEKFKAQFIAQQALNNGGQPMHQVGVYPPLPPPPPMPRMDSSTLHDLSAPDDTKNMSLALKQEAKLVAMLTAFLLAHPLGATIDYLASYVKSMMPDITQNSVNNVLLKYGDIFSRQAKDRWTFVLFDIVKQEGH